VAFGILLIKTMRNDKKDGKYDFSMKNQNKGKKGLKQGVYF